ncbi:MAG: hypothetical protein HUJ25_09335 [Crocinitomicaceae bacterium]|nr:hypothetical protein [Crocinitomicaceae bacterium]
MYRYNSYHKIITVLIVLCWAIFHFSNRSKESDIQYDNGQVVTSGNKENALKEGLWKWYYEDGSVSMQGYFSKGKRTGIWQTFSRNGTLQTESIYENNLLNGTYKKYDSLGNIIEEIEYRNDTIVSRTPKVLGR